MFKIFLSLVFLAFSTVSVADAASEKEAEKLLAIMNIEQTLQQSISQMLDIQLQQNPALAPYKKVMLDFFSKYMSYESLKPDMLNIYSDTFTADELKEIRLFYSTPTGKKTIEKMPLLMAQGGQMGAARVQDNIAELQKMIEEEESKRIQNSASQ